jgi:50S ribosomal protein L16 3-hydroxylase
MCARHGLAPATTDEVNVMRTCVRLCVHGCYARPRMTTTLLGGLTPERFLREYWQKKPLLVRQALPGFTGVVTPEKLCALARRDDTVARAVVERAPGAKGRGPRFTLTEGPLTGLDLTRVPSERFTFLVQAVEMHVPAAWDLLLRFSFIPRARIDDLMVSYATPGGGVGPHYDLYDVFLIQGMGRRRWRVSQQTDLACVDGEGLRILKRFAPTDEWVTEPGDMLYVPPHAAHEGTAIDTCMTYSVGFVAPTNEQIIGNYLGFLESTLADAPVDGIYVDLDLRATTTPAFIDDDMIARVQKTLSVVAPEKERIALFLGRYLTGPKPFSIFPKPKRAIDARALTERLSTSGTLQLTGASRMLVYGTSVFMNGDAHVVDDDAVRALFTTLATVRKLALPVSLDDAGARLVHAWLRQGYVALA